MANKQRSKRLNRQKVIWKLESIMIYSYLWCFFFRWLIHFQVWLDFDDLRLLYIWIFMPVFTFVIRILFFLFWRFSLFCKNQNDALWHIATLN